MVEFNGHLRRASKQPTVGAGGCSSVIKKENTLIKTKPRNLVDKG